MSLKLLTDFTNALDLYSHPQFDQGAIRAPKIFERLNNKVFKKNALGNETAIFNHATELLKNSPRISPRESFRSRHIYILREWARRTHHRKMAKTILATQVAYQNFRKELTAYQLGITSKNLEASEGLQEFSEKKRLFADLYELL